MGTIQFLFKTPLQNLTLLYGGVLGGDKCWLVIIRIPKNYSHKITTKKTQERWENHPSREKTKGNITFNCEELLGFLKPGRVLRANTGRRLASINQSAISSQSVTAWSPAWCSREHRLVSYKRHSDVIAERHLSIATPLQWNTTRARTSRCLLFYTVKDAFNACSQLFEYHTFHIHMI